MGPGPHQRHRARHPHRGHRSRSSTTRPSTSSAQHQAAGRRVYLVSASPEEIVAPLALYLGVDEAIASRARLDETGRYTGEVEFYSYGPFKADAIRAAAAERDIDLDGSYAYSDSATDLPMLEAVGHPFAVNPDRELARIAVERGWEVLQFRHGVPLRERVAMPPPRQTAIGAAALATVATVAVGGWWLWRRQAAADPAPSANQGRATAEPLGGSGGFGCDQGSGVLQLLHREGSEGEDDDEDQELLHGGQLSGARPGRGERRPLLTSVGPRAG